MKATSVFKYRNYKAFLNVVLAPTGETRGARSRLAKELGCQSAFISQVIHGDAHFSLEHAVGIGEFLGLTTSERHFFMLLVHEGRAGSKPLRDYYSKQITQFQEERQQIRERIDVHEGLTSESQMRYYSAWYFAAIHILISVPKFQTRDRIAQALGLTSEIVSETLDFLLKNGLAVEEGGRYRIGRARIHLSPDSPMISKHHTNWRIQAIQSLDSPVRGNLHYSSVISLSEEDALKIREVLLEAIEKSESIFRESHEETSYCIALDLFRLLK